MFADEMDIRSISQWRATCRENYAHAVSSLHRSLTTRIEAVVPYPHTLLDIVTKHGAVFGGELALSFILRADEYRPTNLEIFGSNFHFDHLCSDVINAPRLCAHVASHRLLPCTIFDTMRWHIAQTLIVTMTNGSKIYIHRSYTCSPTDPIARSSCTALSNFVTSYGFGISHPSLTLARRALLADEDLRYMLPIDVITFNRLLSHRFSIAVSPTAWPEFRRHMDGNTLRSAEECWRRAYICPKQGRYFGDPGSFIGFFDPLGGDEDRCMARGIAPFGAMVLWRIMLTFNCQAGCGYRDEVLENGVTSIPVIFKKDPFGELHECVSDRCMRSSPFYRTFARPRTLSF